ncbi:unnamed protein product [Dovyalis caffra]|uniref:VPS9 domain-containing protein n=1 Tax=Dovyalis caffra TaxID=77055 RepID=A0AAV1RVI8_9ROSI|nr:unnamed protein product [Dovyalis caffra]
MEAAFMEHPLWAGATDEEFDSSMEGLEKYVMTKLFSRTFATSPEDVKIDQEISEKIHLLQSFCGLSIWIFLHFFRMKLHGCNLILGAVQCHKLGSMSTDDISVAMLQLLAEKELQKLNAFRAPREKLLCIMSCCRIINNLLLNASMSENHVLGGADDFLPVLIYVTIKARSPWRQAKLVSESAYYLTNLVSAKSFIVELNAKSLSMDEFEFEESMQAAKLDSKVSQVEALQSKTDPGPSTRMHGMETNIDGRSNYPYMEAEPGELTVEDVERLLSLYKDVVTKYSRLCRAVSHPSAARGEPSLPAHKEKGDLLVQPEGQSQMIQEAEEESEHKKTMELHLSNERTNPP